MCEPSKVYLTDYLPDTRANFKYFDKRAAILERITRLTRPRVISQLVAGRKGFVEASTVTGLGIRSANPHRCGEL